MARIRTIKPEFFRHEGLFEAEKETALPLRVAFVALWTVCDRDGRFRWKPRALKLDCLPYDDVDFSRVLDALETREFVVRYAVNGEDFGAIPSFAKHQVVNNRELKSILPEPNENNTLTRGARVKHTKRTPLSPDQGEGEGEQEGEREGNISCASHTRRRQASTRVYAKQFYEVYPKHVDPRAAEKKFDAVVRAGADPEHIIAAARHFAEAHQVAGTDKQFIPAPAVWLNKGGYDSEDLPCAGPNGNGRSNGDAAAMKAFLEDDNGNHEDRRKEGTGNVVPLLPTEWRRE